MAKQKKLTMADCYAELERVCRIVCYYQVDVEELPSFRNIIQGALEQIAKIRKEKEDAAEEKRLTKIRDDNDRFFGRNK